MWKTMTTKEPQQPGLVCLKEERRKQWVRGQGAPHKRGDFHMGTWRTSLGAEQEKYGLRALSCELWTMGHGLWAVDLRLWAVDHGLAQININSTHVHSQTEPGTVGG